MACRALSLDPFTKVDYEFIEEYCLCMKVIANALKYLEGQTHSFGMYLPILFGVRRTLHGICTQNLEHCMPLAKALEGGFHRRQRNILKQRNIKIF